MTTASIPHLDRTASFAKKPRDSNRTDPSRMRVRIIETATQLFRQVGHRKTTVADISREMSMSSANVYRFFRSKQAIEEAVAGELLQEVILAASNAAHRDGPAIQRLRAVLLAVEQKQRFDSDHSNRLYELVASAMLGNWTVASAYADRINSMVAQIISEGQASGELPQGDPMTIARCVLSATSPYLNPALAPGCARLARPTSSQMIDFCIGALGAVARQHRAA